MNIKEVRQKIFSDPQIVEYLKKNKVQQCINYINENRIKAFLPQGHGDMEYIFLEVLDLAGVDILSGINLIDKDVAIFASSDMSTYTNIQAIGVEGMSGLVFKEPVILPRSIVIIAFNAFKDSNFQQGLYIKTNSLKAINDNIFGTYSKLKYDCYIDDEKFDYVKDALIYLRDKNIKIADV